MAQNVVPFGKYKGQPVEVLAEDREYTDWLLGQSWLKDKYQNIYTLIINNFGEPDETPEHNELQALFLDVRFAEKVVAVHYSEIVYKALWQRLMSEWEAGQRFVSVRFEVMGADVYVEFNDGRENRRAHFRIEIKPAVGDDYPAVLRQIRNTRCPGWPILFVDRYTGIGATVEQVIEMFDRSGVKVVFREEAERAVARDHSMLERMCEPVRAAEAAFRKRWSDSYVEAWRKLERLDPGLDKALREQERFFEEAAVSGDDEEIRVHGEALLRGWQAANKRMEDEEIAKAMKALPGAKVIAIRPRS